MKKAVISIPPSKAFVKPRPWRAGSFTLGGDKPLLMGILNVTPDSFHDGGRHATLNKALAHAESLLAAGADILDVGGESSRPGANVVAETEEINRTRPVIEALVKRFACVVSIDTVKSGVARAALDVGAVIVNDISAMSFDPMMLELPQRYHAGVVLNHMRGTPKDMQVSPTYSDVVMEVKEYLLSRIQLLAAMGIGKDFIAVDPGIGFGKRVEDNYRLIAEVEKFDDLGCPILLGMSRKSFMGNTPGLEQSDRLMPSVTLAVLAALKGVSILRVHDVAQTREALSTLAAVMKMV